MNPSFFSYFSGESYKIENKVALDPPRISDMLIFFVFMFSENTPCLMQSFQLNKMINHRKTLSKVRKCGPDFMFIRVFNI